MSEIDNKIILGIFAVFTAVYGWLLRHLFGKVQYKDNCGEIVKRLEDCIEAEMRRNTERYGTLEKKIDRLTDIALKK